MKELKGMCVPVCTTFDSAGDSIDEVSYLKHIDAMIEAGVHIIMVCGGTGEFAYLSTEEKRRLVEISARHVEGRAMFVAQTSAISTRDTIEATKHAADQGVDAAMILPPILRDRTLRACIIILKRSTQQLMCLSWCITFPNIQESILRRLIFEGF